MAVTNVWTIGAANIAGTTFHGVNPGNVNTGMQWILEHGAGSVDPSFTALMTQEPMFDLTVSDIAAALGVIPFEGVAGAAQFNLTKVKLAGTREAGSVHFRTVTPAACFSYVRSITVQQGGLATAKIECHPYFDGTNALFTYTDGVALVATTISQLFTLGKVVVNGAEVDAVQGVEIDYGVEVQKESSAGSAYPHFIYIKTRKPKVTVTTKNISVLNSFALNGTEISGGTVYLRKLKKNGVRETDVTAAHISIAFTGTQGVVYAESAGGNNNESAEAKFCIQPTAGASPIWTISTNVAIA